MGYRTIQNHPDVGMVCGAHAPPADAHLIGLPAGLSDVDRLKDVALQAKMMLGGFLALSS